MNTGNFVDFDDSSALSGTRLNVAPPDDTCVPTRAIRAPRDGPANVDLGPARPAGARLAPTLFAAFPADATAGLRGHRSHDVIDVGTCLIAHPAITDLGLTSRRWPGETSVEALVAVGSGERAVIVSPGRGAGTTDRSASIQDITADAVLRRAGHRLTPMRGHGYLSQHAAGRDWRVSAGVFWQVHPAAADVLTGAVMASLEARPGDTALDLYCGAGLFAGALAPAVGPGGMVVGVEADDAAVRDARHNLREWSWARVHKGDVATVLGRGGLPPARLAVADPPRAGLAREVIEYLGAAQNGIGRLAYVSCDPATLARDIGLLTGRGWTLEGLRAFDAFPMTHHVECVATLTAPRVTDQPAEP